MNGRVRLAVLLSTFVSLSFSGTAHAHIVQMKNGRSIRAESVATTENELTLTLSGGAKLTVARSGVAAIVSDDGVPMLTANAVNTSVPRNAGAGDANPLSGFAFWQDRAMVLGY